MFVKIKQFLLWQNTNVHIFFQTRDTPLPEGVDMNCPDKEVLIIHLGLQQIN